MRSQFSETVLSGVFHPSPVVPENRLRVYDVRQVIDQKEDGIVFGMSMVVSRDRTLFIADTHIRYAPSPDEIARTVIGAARHVRRFGLEPQIALCSQSQFGNSNCDSGQRLRAAMEILGREYRDFTFDGEMNIDTALNPELRERIFPNSRLKGPANTLIFAHADAASGVRNILKMRADGLEVGPILMGMGNRAHIVTPSITPRGLLNMAAIAGTPVAHYG